MMDAIQSTKKIWAAKKAKKKKKSQRRDSHERAKDEADEFFENAMKKTNKPKPKSKSIAQDMPTKKKKTLLSNFFRPRIETTPPDSSPPLIREEHDSPQLPRKLLHGGAKRPLSSISSFNPKSSKYFQKEKTHDSQKTPKKIRRTDDYPKVRKNPKVNLQGFIDTLEVQKASTYNLNEYLALESKQKELLGSSGKALQPRKSPVQNQKVSRFASQSSGSGGKSSWNRDQERFREKQGPGQIKLSSKSSLDTWLARKNTSSEQERSPGLKKTRVSQTSLEAISSPAARGRHQERATRQRMRDSAF